MLAAFSVTINFGYSSSRPEEKSSQMNGLQVRSISFQFQNKFDKLQVFARFKSQVYYGGNKKFTLGWDNISDWLSNIISD